MFHVSAISVLFQSHMNSSCSYVANSFDLGMYKLCLFYWLGCQPIANPHNLEGQWVTS